MSRIIPNKHARKNFLAAMAAQPLKQPKELSLQEKNRLLATFEGMVWQTTEGGKTYYWFPYDEEKRKRASEMLDGRSVAKNEPLLFESLKYDKSWNWIYPLFLKCRVELNNQIRLHRDELLADVNKDFRENYKHPLSYLTQAIVIDILPNASATIDYYFNWCVKFVEWYNQNKR
jgi:hypothetical protein